MTQNPMDLGQNLTAPDRNPLTLVREDMDVYDVNGDHIGEVEFVYLGETNPTASERGQGSATVTDPRMRGETIVDVVARAFADDEVPDVLQRRLLHEGYIRVEGDGLFASDRYVLPTQIASVSGEGVRLNVPRSELIKD